MTPTQTRILAAARGWIGTPYRHQASLRGIGADCLGLVRGVWREVYGAEPEQAPAYTADWAERGGVESLRDAARRHLAETPTGACAPGDLLLFRARRGAPPKHAAIRSASARMIHAYAGHAVAETALSDWWARRLAFAFRFPEIF